MGWPPIKGSIAVVLWWPKLPCHNKSNLHISFLFLCDRSMFFQDRSRALLMREFSISMSDCGLRVLHRRDQSILYSCSNLFINQPRLINPIWLSNTSDQPRVTAKNLNIVFHCVILHQHNYYASSSSQKGSGVRKNKPPHQRRMSDSHGGKKALDWFSLLVQSQGSNIRNQLLPFFAWRKFTVETQPFFSW